MSARGRSRSGKQLVLDYAIYIAIASALGSLAVWSAVRDFDVQKWVGLTMLTITSTAYVFENRAQLSNRSIGWYICGGLVVVHGFVAVMAFDRLQDIRVPWWGALAVAEIFALDTVIRRIGPGPR